MSDTNVVPANDTIITGDSNAAIARLLTSMPQLIERVQSVLRVIHDLETALNSMVDGSYIVSPWRECLRCGHRWRAKSGIFPPKTCPKCSSTGWAVPPSTPWHRRPGDPAGAASQRRLEGMQVRPNRSRARQRAKAGLPLPQPHATPAVHKAEPVPPEELIGTRGASVSTTPPPPPGMRPKPLAERLREQGDVRQEVRPEMPLPEADEDLGLGEAESESNEGEETT